jgi:hypothetical protein
MRRQILACCSLFVAAALAGCGAAPTDDFSDLSALGEKSDAFSRKMTLVGSLDYGQTSSAATYSYPHYLAWKFAGQPGDVASATITSSDGTPVGWIVDNTFKVLARVAGDDGSATVEATLAANKNPDIHTYYVIVRDRDFSDSSFQVSLARKVSPMFACNVDTDCVAVQKAMCCPNGTKIAIHAGYEQEYQDENQCTNPPAVCPLYVINDTRVAVCEAGQCTMVQPPTTCIDKVACIQGSHWSDFQCKCVPDFCVDNVLCTITSHWDSYQCTCIPN